MEEKRGIVEETLEEGTWVALVSWAHGINANQVFVWRRLYLAGRLGGSGAIKVTALASLAQRDGSMFGDRPGTGGALATESRRENVRGLKKIPNETLMQGASIRATPK